MSEGEGGYKPTEEKKTLPKEQQSNVELSQRLSNEQLFTREDELIRDKGFLIDVASACDEAYKQTERSKLEQAGQEVPGWLQGQLFTPEERSLLTKDAATLTDQEKQTYEKAQTNLAINTAGLYALQEGLGIAASFKPDNPHAAHETLTSLVQGTETQADKALMSRLAHATWAAGQPFRGRETRPVMKPFDRLPTDEQFKDMVQIRAAAKVMAANLTPSK